MGNRRATIAGLAAWAAAPSWAAPLPTLAEAPLDWFDLHAPPDKYYPLYIGHLRSIAGARTIVERLWRSYESSGTLRHGEWALVYGYHWWRISPLGPARLKVAEIGRQMALRIERDHPDSPVGPFWAASYAGAVALGRGVLESLRLVPENQARIEAVYRRWPDYFYGGAGMILGKGYIKVPPFPLSVGDLSKGIAILERVRAERGRVVALWYLFMAEGLYFRDGLDPALKMLDRIDAEVVPQDSGERYALETTRRDAARFRQALIDGSYDKYRWDPLLEPLEFG